MRVTDLQGTPIVTLGDVGEAPSMRFEHASVSADLRVVVYVPEHVFYETVQPITHMILRMILLALSGALLYSAVYAYFHFRPMLSLLEYIETHHAQAKHGGNLFEQARHTLASLSAERVTLLENYSRISELMYISAFHRAVSGAALEKEEEELLSSRPLFQDGYRCAAIDCDAHALPERKAFLATLRLRLEATYPVSEVLIAECLIVALPADQVSKEDALDGLLALA